MISGHLQTCFGNNGSLARSRRWGMASSWAAGSGIDAKPHDILCAFIGMIKVAALILSILMPIDASLETEDADASFPALHGATAAAGETLIAAYTGYPHFLRSDVHLTRPGGTDLQLHDLSWDGEPFRFPIYVGARAARWGGLFGAMIDFTHNKAVARLGRGAHGRGIKDAIIEEVKATGLLKGQPPPATIKLNEILDRLEFTHGHNTLLFTGLMRLGSLSPRLRPYVGLGFGLSIPHTEIWLKDENDKTDEYQLAGPAVQALAGLELRFERMSYFVEYKFTLAWNRGELTGEQSRFNEDIPGDLMRQVMRWWNAEQPKFGHYDTNLAAHQVVIGAGARFSATAPSPP